jgi:hypothetical protein
MNDEQQVDEFLSADIAALLARHVVTCRKVSIHSPEGGHCDP